MLLNHLENVRSRSEASRRRYTVVASFVLTSFIVLIWLSVYLAQRSVQERSQQAQTAQNTHEEEQRSIKDRFLNSFRSNGEATAEESSASTRTRQDGAQFENAFRGIVPQQPASHTATTSTFHATTSVSTATTSRTTGSLDDSDAPVATDEQNDDNEAGFVESLLEETGQ